MIIEVPQYVKQVIDALESKGFQAFVVGGCVRDSLMGKVPHDWDMATSASVREMLDCFKSFRTIQTGIRHGTLTVLSEGHPVEVTTYRTGTDEKGPITLEMDLSHRDLTINAMAFHPDKGIIDLFHGQEDIQQKQIRFVGSAHDRIEEDGLRLLRALRFASALDFQIDEEAHREIRKNAGYLAVVAPERIFSEFKKLLVGTGAHRVVETYPMVWAKFLPEAAISLESKKVALAIRYSEPTEVLRLAIAFMETDKALPYTEHSVGHYLKMLRSDTATQDMVKKILSFPYDDLVVDQKAVHHLVAEKSLTVVNLAIDYYYALRAASFAQEKDAQDKVGEKRDQLRACVQRIVDEGGCQHVKDLHVTGSDLMQADLTIKGPLIGVCLNHLLDAVIDEKVENQKDSLVAFALSNVDAWCQ